MEINIIDSCSKIFTFCSGNLATYKDEKTTTKMEGDKNGRWQNGRRPKIKMTKMEDNQNGRRR